MCASCKLRLSPYPIEAISIIIWGLATEFFSEGMEIWVMAENPYNEQASCGESDHCSYRLGMAWNVNEMFQVFSKFNALFV